MKVMNVLRSPLVLLRILIRTLSQFFNCTHTLRIIVVGTKKSGKTSILRRLAGDCFYENGHTTVPDSNSLRMSYCYSVDDNICKKELQVTELCVSTEESILIDWVQKADGIILVYSTENAQDMKYLHSTFAKLLRVCTHKKRSCSIIYMCTKIDLIDSNVLNKYLENLHSNEVDQMPERFDVSAKTNEGISEAFLYLLKSCLNR